MSVPKLEASPQGPVQLTLKENGLYVPKQTTKIAVKKKRAVMFKQKKDQLLLTPLNVNMLFAPQTC